MRIYFVRMSDPQSDEYFFKVGVTATSTKERFAYGNQKVIDSDLPFGEKVKTMLSGVKYIPDCEYIVEELHSVDYQYEQDAYLGEEHLLKTFKSLSYRPSKILSGATECFKPSQDDEHEYIASVIARMDTDSLQRNTDAPSELKYKVLGMSVREHDSRKRHLAILERYRQESKIRGD